MRIISQTVHLQRISLGMTTKHQKYH